MDNFMEKITHRFSANDMIKANMQADAVELDSAKETLALFENQMNKVDVALSDMRQVNLKNIETAQEVQTLTRESTGKIKEASEASIAGISKTSEASIAGINKTVDESLAKIASIQDSSDSVDAVKDAVNVLEGKIDTLRRDLEEYMHTDHVKIYRNVQASMIEELAKSTDEVKKATKKKGVLLTFAIITMVISLGNLTLLLLLVMGLI